MRWLETCLFPLVFLMLALATMPAAHAFPEGYLAFEDVDCGKPIELTTFIGEDGGYGFKDSDGNVVLAPVYHFAWNFNSSGYGYADGAYIDASGTPVFTIFMVDNGPDYIFEGLHRFQRDGKVGFLTACMEVAIEPRFEVAGYFRDGYAAVCEGCRLVPMYGDDWEHTKWVGGQWGIIDKTGAYVVPPTLSDDEIDKAIDTYRRGKREMTDAGKN